MIMTYIRRNLWRRKVRTILMVLSLIVGVGTLVALNATVESYRRFYAGSVSGKVGDFDLILSRPETAPNRLFDPAETLTTLATVPGVRTALPRIQGTVTLIAGDKRGDTLMVARRADDTLGDIEVEEGAADVAVQDGVPGAIVLQQTADVLGLKVGDAVEIQYAPPPSRLKGRAPDEGASRRRTTGTWTVRAIATQRGVTGQDGNEGVLVDLGALQERFGLGKLAERIAVDYDRSLYDSRDPQRSAFRTRAVTDDVRAKLGDADWVYLMPRPRAVIDGANAFIFWQSLITMYGVLSLSVVGMLIRTLIMTNVQEQTRDMAILRILGAPRRHLFNIVAAEVAAVGSLGIGLGLVVGQAVNNLAIAPFIANRAGETVADLPLVSVRAITISVITAFLVLALSTWAPAHKAATTKITHAINPGVADGLGLEDLAKLRERRPDFKVSGRGLVVLTYPALVFFVFPLAFDFGILWVLSALIFGSLLSLIVGAALVFYIVILPFERLLVFVLKRFAPRIGYFVQRTTFRGKVRNTLISLMIVMSATLPAFLSTSLALGIANTDTDQRLTGGAPFVVWPAWTFVGRAGGASVDPNQAAVSNFRPELLNEVRSDADFGATAALTYEFRTRVKDGVGLRDANVRALGVDADLRPVLYPEAIEMVAGDDSAVARVAGEPNTIVIGAALATYLDLGVGDELVIVGGGRDHEVPMTIVGVAKRIGGVGNFTAKQTAVWGGDCSVLMGLESFRILANDPQLGPPDKKTPIVRRLFATHGPGIDEQQLTSDLRLRYATQNDLTIDSTAETVQTIREESKTGQLFLIVLTALTSVLAVFGVFAVIYVSIYGRRGEIGMMKAIGTPGRHLLGVFVGEAMIMTLSATLTGVTAGVLLAYALRMSEGFRNELPTHFAMDVIVVPAMLVLMILASLVSATWATHGYRKRPAIAILRTL
ncbi:MAG: ABC transporter permease [Ardenticatenales bacterium]|jgi:ABC-type lipoprotein release transport system permease subunit|nr:ABC transporter permease [Ardenticatenales bacterium]